MRVFQKPGQEVKNSVFGSWASAMIGAGFFKTLSHEHLPVGHTHEDIGKKTRIRMSPAQMLTSAS